MHFSGLEDISSSQDGIVGFSTSECTTAPCQEQQLQRELLSGYFSIFSLCFRCWYQYNYLLMEKKIQ